MILLRWAVRILLAGAIPLALVNAAEPPPPSTPDEAHGRALARG